jgi:Cd2+/Zn2+-exporting ATPase
MLTGDTAQTAAAVARKLEMTKVQAGLLPDDKEKIVSGLVEEGRTVMMIGDGVNDAPSLARANVGVAMGGLGSDVALNAADIVLMQDKLSLLPELVRLGRRTNRVIRQNLTFGSAVIGTLVVGSLVWDTFFPASRNLILPFAVIGHEGSTVLVILNGLRLLR